MLHHLRMQAPAATAFTITTCIFLSFFAVEKGTMLYEEYVMQALIIEKDFEFLQRCQTPEGYAKMNHHPNFCEKIITTARVGAFWHALNKVASSLPTKELVQLLENASWKFLAFCAALFILMPTFCISAVRTKNDQLPCFIKTVP